MMDSHQSHRPTFEAVEELEADGFDLREFGHRRSVTETK
jgi:hypothetical protein